MDREKLVERLRRTKPNNGHYKDDSRSPINPDGPDAAAQIEADGQRFDRLSHDLTVTGERYKAAITRIAELEAQLAEREPVAWLYERHSKSDPHNTERRVGPYLWPDWMKQGWTETPLYGATQEAHDD